MMRTKLRTLIAPAAAFMLGAAVPALANWVALDGNRNPMGFLGISVGGNQMQQVAPSDASGTPFSAANPFPVRTVPGGATSTDASGTVTVGGTYQSVIASSGARKGCLIQNPTTASEPLNVKFASMAQPFTLAPGAAIGCQAGGIVITDAVTVTAATAGHAFAALAQ